MGDAGSWLLKNPNAFLLGCDEIYKRQNKTMYAAVYALEARDIVVIWIVSSAFAQTEL